jgi:hypothetical protein
MFAGAMMLGVGGTGAGLAAISNAANGNKNKDFITLPGIESARSCAAASDFSVNRRSSVL